MFWPKSHFQQKKKRDNGETKSEEMEKEEGGKG